MTFFDFFYLTCGLSLFLYGMQRTEKSLQLSAGTRIKHAIESLTCNRILGVLVGLVITMLTQSSSATTALLVGFASAGLITLTQSLGILLGTGIGTTITVQLFAYNITRFAPLLISIGYGYYAFGKSNRKKNVGQLILGIGMILYGMTLMADAVGPLRNSHVFSYFSDYQGSSIVLILAAAVFTAVIQSSAASIALIISLATPSSAMHSSLTLTNAIALLLGANIGTCATALISSIRADTEGKRIAWAHTILTFAGVVVIFPFIPLLETVARWSTPGNMSIQIANIHTLFNVFKLLLFIPFLGFISTGMKILIRQKKETSEPFDLNFINQDFTHLPSLALGQASRELSRMSGLVTSMLQNISVVLVTRNIDTLESIMESDNKVDFLQEKISLYLARLSEVEMNDRESQNQIHLLMICSELEQIGDCISKDMCTHCRKLIACNLCFSKDGIDDIKTFHNAIHLNLYTTINAFSMNDLKAANDVIDMKKKTDTLENQLRIKHFNRLKGGLRETAETTTIHLDFIETLSRISSHCHKIARSVIIYNEQTNPQ